MISTAARLRAAILVAALFASPAAADDIRIYAAASTAPFLNNVAQVYREETGDRVVVVVAASSILARQIENGAPADLFVSANTQWADYVARVKNVPDDQRSRLFSNRMAIIASLEAPDSETPLTPLDLKALLAGGRFAMCDPNGVPCGIYAQQALESTKLDAIVRERRIIGNNARTTLAWVERGEAAAGIVYLTDARSSDKVKVVQVMNPATHSPIYYELAVLAPERPEVVHFAEYLTDKPARRLAQEYGFVLIRTAR